MKQRKMNLAAFVVAGPVSGHHGGWRYPTADSNLLSFEYYRNVGRILEDGRFDLIFFADILAIPNRYEGKLDSQGRAMRGRTLLPSRPDTLVYDGSLHEWAPDETLPMETGLSGPV